MATQRICSIPNCGKCHYAHGWCKLHYKRWERNGDPAAGRISQGDAERYFSEVVMLYDEDKCLTWPFARTTGGYGKLKGKVVSRRLCEEAYGPAPTTDHQAAHSCGMGHLACVAKRHLSWKTPKENCADRSVHGACR